MKVQEIMTKDPSCITRSDTVQNAAGMMRDQNVGALPVVSDHINKELIGMVTDRDITIRAVAEGLCEATIAQVMSRESMVTASPEDDINDVMKLMMEQQVRRVPVIDEHNR